MSRSAYPVVQDVTALLTNAGLVAQPLPDFGQYLQAAIRCWEEMTGFMPFLGAQSVTYFDPPGPNKGDWSWYYGGRMGGGQRLDARGGIVSLNSLKVGRTPTYSGTQLTLNTDFWLEPFDGPRMGHPYTIVRFLNRQWGPPQSVAIDAMWGWGTTVPDDAWQAVLFLAGILASAESAGADTGGLKSISLGSSSYQFFDDGAWAPAIRAWSISVNQTALRYKVLQI